MVEMAAISYGILMVPEKLWDPLEEKEKNRLADWLYQINRYSQADNNWQYFKVITNLALRSVGRKWSEEQVKDAWTGTNPFILEMAGIPMENGRKRITTHPLEFIFTAFSMRLSWDRTIRRLQNGSSAVRRNLQRPFSIGSMMRGRRFPLAVP